MCPHFARSVISNIERGRRPCCFECSAHRRTAEFGIKNKKRKTLQNDEYNSGAMPPRCISVQVRAHSVSAAGTQLSGRALKPIPKASISKNKAVRLSPVCSLDSGRDGSSAGRLKTWTLGRKCRRPGRYRLSSAAPHSRQSPWSTSLAPPGSESQWSRSTVGQKECGQLANLWQLESELESELAKR